MSGCLLLKLYRHVSVKNPCISQTDGYHLINTLPSSSINLVIYRLPSTRLFCASLDRNILVSLVVCFESTLNDFIIRIDIKVIFADQETFFRSIFLRKSVVSRGKVDITSMKSGGNHSKIARGNNRRVCDRKERKGAATANIVGTVATSREKSLFDINKRCHRIRVHRVHESI